MTELGLLWRVRKEADTMEARLGYDESRGHVVELYWNDRVMSSEVFEDGPAEAIQAAELRRGELLVRGWTHDSRVPLADA